MNRYLISIAVIAAVFLSACDSSTSESAQMEAAIAVALENAAQDPVRPEPPLGLPAGGPPNGAPPPGALPPPGGGRPLIEPSSIETYKAVGDSELSAHLFNPEGHTTDDSRAVLIFMHGGGMRGGSPQQGYDLAARLIPEGISVVSIQYRLLDTPDRTLDEIISDAKSSVRWLRENASDLGYDPDRIVISGHSAGAYLALTTGVIDKFDESSENLDISSIPNQMILWSVPVSRSDNPENSMVPEGYSIDDFIPANYIADSMPPALFLHGNADTTVAFEPAMAFHQQYGEAGNQTKFHLIDGADHFFRRPEHRAQVFNLISDYLVSIDYASVQHSD